MLLVFLDDVSPLPCRRVKKEGGGSITTGPSKLFEV